MDLRTGAVIHLRNRIWRVDRVEEREFAATPLDGRDAKRWRFLCSFEEQYAQPGEMPPPDPKKVSDPATQDLLLRAYRLSLIHGSAPFMGLQRSRAIPEPYQQVPLLIALDMPRVRLLIGNDVGVGKTIEAGLIVSELLARGWAERMLVVVPAPLRKHGTNLSAVTTSVTLRFAVVWLDEYLTLLHEAWQGSEPEGYTFSAIRLRLCEAQDSMNFPPQLSIPLRVNFPVCTGLTDRNDGMSHCLHCHSF